MSALTNPRHERFAQELAKGKSADEAYVLAGYKANRGNAIRLKANEHVVARLAELQGQVAKKTLVTVAGITTDLLRLAKKGEALKSAPGLSTARAALMDAAKLNGLVVDKSEVEHSGRLISDRPLTPEEWAAQHVPPAETTIQ